MNLEIFDPDTYYIRLVHAAAEYMDEVKPDWWKEVDPVIFDLNCPTYCVCGQNDLDWQEIALQFQKTVPPGTPFLPNAFSWDELEPLWLEEIAQRMPVPVREQVLA